MIRTLTALVLVLAALTAAAAACGGDGDNDAEPGPRAVVEAYWKAFNDRVPARMLDLFSSACTANLNRETTIEALRLGLADLDDARVRVDEIEVDEQGDRATVRVTAVYEGGPVDGQPAADPSQPMRLRRDGETWKLADCSLLPTS